MHYTRIRQTKFKLSLMNSFVLYDIDKESNINIICTLQMNSVVHIECIRVRAQFYFLLLQTV